MRCVLILVIPSRHWNNARTTRRSCSSTTLVWRPAPLPHSVSERALSFCRCALAKYVASRLRPRLPVMRGEPMYIRDTGHPLGRCMRDSSYSPLSSSRRYERFLVLTLRPARSSLAAWRSWTGPSGACPHNALTGFPLERYELYLAP